MTQFADGWEKLSPLERIAHWMKENKPRLRGHVKEYRTLLENFSISVKNPAPIDYLNFQHDIRYYSPKHQEVLKDGFFAMYNLPQDAMKEQKSFDPAMN